MSRNTKGQQTNKSTTIGVGCGKDGIPSKKSLSKVKIYYVIHLYVSLCSNRFVLDRYGYSKLRIDWYRDCNLPCPGMNMIPLVSRARYFAHPASVAQGLRCCCTARMKGTSSPAIKSMTPTSRPLLLVVGTTRREVHVEAHLDAIGIKLPKAIVPPQGEAIADSKTTGCEL